MTDATLTILMTATPPTLVALGALAVGIINAIQGKKIHVLVNSNMTAVKAELSNAKIGIEDLKGIISKRLVDLTQPDKDIVASAGKVGGGIPPR